MEKGKYMTWLLEFLCITAIAVILSLANWSKHWILVPIAAILGLKVYEYKVAVEEKHLRVRVQLNLLIKLVLFEDVSYVRCTYHVPVWRKLFFQIFNYIPSGGGRGRKFSRMKGIIGKAFVEKRPLVENFESDEEFREQMVQKYNYATEELQQRTADRKSYFCHPILDENHRVLGLIYLDSSHPKTFVDDPNNRKMQMITRACEAIKDSLL